MTQSSDLSRSDPLSQARRRAPRRGWVWTSTFGVAREGLVCANRVLRAARAIPSSLLLIPPAAPGSLGDEAMVLATCDAVRRSSSCRIGIVRYRAGADYPVAADAILDLSRYFHQGGARAEELRLLHALFSYRSVALLGADILDGFYSDDAVRLRLRLVELAARAGAQTALLGFSFNSAPTLAARQLIARLPLTTRLLARDRLSHASFASATDRIPERAADMAFLLRPDAGTDSRAQALAEWAAIARSRGHRVLAVNVSAVAMQAAGMTPADALDFAQRVIERVLDRRERTSLVFVPHDFRGQDSDDCLLRALAHRFAHVSDTDMQRLEAPLSAAFIKAVAQHFDAVWTGRMHFAIAALGQAVPAVAHEYQGKFSGLFAEFGLEALVCPPRSPPSPDAVADLLVNVLDDAPRLKRDIAARLPAQLALAKRNIDALHL